MPEPKAYRNTLAGLMAGGQKALVPHLAEMLKREGIEELDASDERERFWQSALTDAQEQEMWRQEMAARGITQLVPGSPGVIDIGLKISKSKYPTRWDMAPGEGREHESEQATWAYKQAKKGPPKPKGPAPMTSKGDGTV